MRFWCPRTEKKEKKNSKITITDCRDGPVVKSVFPKHETGFQILRTHINAVFHSSPQKVEMAGANWQARLANQQALGTTERPFLNE